MAPDYLGKGRGRSRYATMPLSAICQMRVADVVADNAVLLLWAPNAIVLDGDATKVALAWGFKPKQLIPWVKTAASGKPRLGGGHYTRVVTEQLLLCTRGSVKSRRRDIAGIVFAQRGEHSAKPDESYEMVEQLFPGPYLELFARRRRSEAWAVWGNEAPHG